MSSELDPKHCKHIKQRAAKWCVEACLESFLADNDITKKQEEMVKRGIENKVCDEDGVMPNDPGKDPEYRNMIDFFALFGVELKKLSALPTRIERGDGVLVATWHLNKTGGAHCVRFCDRVNEEKFRVMDPAPDPEKFPTWQRDWIRTWPCDIFGIRLIREAQTTSA